MIAPDDREVNQNAAPEPADSPNLIHPPKSVQPAKQASGGDVSGRPEELGQREESDQREESGRPEAAGTAEDAGEPGAAGLSSGDGNSPSASERNAGGAEPADAADADQLPPSQSLAEAVSRLGLDISTEKLAKLDEYCQRLWELNAQINLTRHTTYDLFARRDLLDTYELAKSIGPDEEVLDVGSGGGVPGIPLAILRPDLKVSLCDSVAKKARAAETLVSQLKLPVYVHALRVQDVLEEHSFDTLVTRAVGSITQLCNWLNNNWHCFNRLLAIKGPRWVDERKEARHRGVLHGTVLRRIHGYRMPGTNSESVILQLHRPRPGSTS